tara:strand:- start:2287 stop:3111 length:825 start_codon:yes stop_codon:yes gene_type:complete
MKIKRMIMSLNNSKLYSGMWDMVAEIYEKTTDIIPTLIFCGTKEELDMEVKSGFGEVYRLNKYPNVVQDPNMDWSVTWAPFWAASNLFPDDVCCTSGIDVIPISDILWKKIDEIKDDKYVVGRGAKPYGNIGHVASGRNIAKGKTFKRVLEIEDDFEKELIKIWNLRMDLQAREGFNWNLKNQKWWGLDEAYISSKVYENKDVVFIDAEWVLNNLSSKKIDRMFRCRYDLDRLKSKDYWHAHIVRPITNPQNYKIVQDLIKDMGLTLKYFDNSN